ncbi:MAG: aminoacetone oxidase family FAD-binding enzyme [Phenylobacterium sp.]|uniref:TIGR03862 family flavoprotein n=1 Tax=Phenylobacterium sp. TaxID=1871053 RepID=UPI0025DF0EAC|nr:TIGR03862 family flavoprotein [Phenylobacterium sp.]MBA4011306.1 aminoacetone oxidase family FAD-binding enzyme [Phenylobacterium sp.]
MSTSLKTIAVVGGGPAGLIAAETLSAAGAKVTLYERMPTLGRKFLMAGRGGLNLTHSEELATFVGRYGEAASWLKPMIEAFSPADLQAWAQGLGQETFVGSSGRVFPKALKASPLLRAWLARLSAQGVELRLRREWRGWDAAGGLLFAGADDAIETAVPDATILALGGASWPKLGSTGGWASLLADRGVALAPFQSANSGFDVGWSAMFAERFAGEPLKNIALTFDGRTVRGEAMIAAYGIEGGAIYALSASLREALATDGAVTLEADLTPDVSRAKLTDRLHRAAGGQSTTNLLRKAAGLSPLAINLLREAHGVDLPREPGALARAIKTAPLRLTGMRPLDRAISSAGGVTQAAVDGDLMLRAVPGVYVAGEMLDWEAPTGGYLLQACFATGVHAARSILKA